MSGIRGTVRSAGVSVRALALFGVVALAGPAGAAPVVPPSLSAASTVAGAAAPAPFATGEWTPVDGVWTASLRTWSAPSGSTAVSAAWRSPWVSATRNRVVFAAAATTAQQSVLGNYAFEQWVRLCTRSRCERWQGIGTDSVPNNVDPATLPYRIEVANGLTVRWRGATTAVRVEWRYTQTQRDASYAETTVRVASGAAAARVTT